MSPRLLPAFVLLSVLASWVLPVAAYAAPDPLSDRQKPTFQKPAPPPAPKKSGQDTPDKDEAAADEHAKPESRTGVGTSASASLEQGKEVESAKGASRKSGDKPGGEGGRKALGVEDGSYRLGPRDQLRVEVWNRAEVEYEWRPVTVTDDGSLYLPLLDNVKVGGMTVTDAIAKLTKLYDSYIIEPQVFIQITEYNSRQVSVIGEVKNPGRFALKGDLTLTQVLAEAGDLTKYASRTVRVIRHPAENPEVRDIDLDRINQGDSRENLRIQPDDEIYVMTNKNVVYVSGLVKSEGYVDFSEGMTAQQAVILAGGLAEGAAGGRAKIFRVGADGKTRELKVNVKDKTNPVPLQPGDIVHVPRSIF